MEGKAQQVNEVARLVEGRFSLNDEALNGFVQEALDRIGAPLRLEHFDYEDGATNAGLGELFFMAADEGVIDAPPDFSPMMIAVLPVFCDDVLVLLRAPYVMTCVSGGQLDASRFGWDVDTDSLREGIRAALAAVVKEANELIPSAYALAGDPADWSEDDDDSAEDDHSTGDDAAEVVQ